MSKLMVMVMVSRTDDAVHHKEKGVTKVPSLVTWYRLIPILVTDNRIRIQNIKKIGLEWMKTNACSMLILYQSNDTSSMESSDSRRGVKWEDVFRWCGRCKAAGD